MIPNGGHALEAILNWDNTDAIYQCEQIVPPYNQDVAFSDGRVYYIRAYDLTDGDGDGCNDSAELQPKSQGVFGGGRNPNNAWDFYDVSVPKDGQIDLFTDILGVIGHYSLDGNPPYNAYYDRGPAPQGANSWEMTAPDGVIDLFTDIMGVQIQYGHSCT